MNFLFSRNGWFVAMGGLILVVALPILPDLKGLLRFPIPASAGLLLAYFFPDIFPPIKGLTRKNPLLWLAIITVYVILIIWFASMHSKFGSVLDYVERVLCFSYYYWLGVTNDTWPPTEKRWKGISDKAKALARKVALIHHVPKPSLT